MQALLERHGKQQDNQKVEHKSSTVLDSYVNFTALRIFQTIQLLPAPIPEAHTNSVRYKLNLTNAGVSLSNNVLKMSEKCLTTRKAVYLMSATNPGISRNKSRNRLEIINLKVRNEIVLKKTVSIWQL